MRWLAKRRVRAAIVAAGILCGHAILYGPSLIGEKVLLPVDLHAVFGLPADSKSPPPENTIVADAVLAYEPLRQLVANEIRAGRLPLWNPYIYAGTPIARWEQFSPFNLVYLANPGPFSLVWVQLLKSLVAGLGAYAFFRSVGRARFWPAAIGAWCYPMTGFFVLWLSFPISAVATWLPWTLLAAHHAIHRPLGWGGPAMALFSAAAILTGHVDVAGQVLLATALFTVWCFIDRFGWWPRRRGAWAVLAVPALGVALGFLLASPYLLPITEYTESSGRIAERGAGAEDRPPVGPDALPQIVLPDIQGTHRYGDFRVGEGNLLESLAAGYSGLIATLLLAPLAFLRRRLRSFHWCLVALAFFGAAWTLNVPGIVTVLRLPGLNMMSHNRFVFVTSFALLALAVSGLGAIPRASPRRLLWTAAACALAGFGAICVLCAVELPESVHSRIVGFDPSDFELVKSTFVGHYSKGALLFAVGAAGWVLLGLGKLRSRRAIPVLGAVIVGELLWFAFGANPQCDPALYAPRIDTLARLEKTPGRVLGVACLTPNVTMSLNFREVRGYDGIDPTDMIDLLELARLPESKVRPYARTLSYVPRYERSADGSVALPPVLDMLGVRHLLFCEPPGVRPSRVGDGYWVVRNPRALPRAFVPQRVVIAADRDERLRLLGAPDFQPADVACVERAVSVPAVCRGTAKIVSELPTRVVLRTDMQTSGLVVLTDRWDRGWRASLNGEPTEILRTNHALRGVLVPEGRFEIVFTYEPPAFWLGVRLMTMGIIALGIWVMLCARWAKRPPLL